MFVSDKAFALLAAAQAEATTLLFRFRRGSKRAICRTEKCQASKYNLVGPRGTPCHSGMLKSQKPSATTTRMLPITAVCGTLRKTAPLRTNLQLPLGPAPLPAQAAGAGVLRPWPPQNKSPPEACFINLKF